MTGETSLLGVDDTGAWIGLDYPIAYVRWTEQRNLQAFVSRFSANASKARQATSRAKQIEKIKRNSAKHNM